MKLKLRFQSIEVNMGSSEFKARYYELYNLMAAYFAYDADCMQFDEEVTLTTYLNNSRILPTAKKALLEAKELLTINPFPEAVIADLSNITSTVETRKEWLENVVKLLEKKIEKMEGRKNSSNQNSNDTKAIF